ncbi:MAG: hypothetical protein A3J38_00785 [Gammaproteobacteria bacterium RIFCSPHIGHO2_12_FULL_45_9]|nr:MAG: hypothetical protein A3J38_00785 [Gammaproteobacteria bacterium RIFCSPHIGHO2_12_FULL_45_9]
MLQKVCSLLTGRRLLFSPCAKGQHLFFSPFVKGGLRGILVWIAVNALLWPLQSAAETKRPLYEDGVQVRAKPGTVALTFDYGPDPRNTPGIVAILDRYHIHATFFIEAQFARRHPELVKLVVEHGNTVANHSMTHPLLTKTPKSQWHYEIVEAKQVIEKASGQKVVCMRPPFGMTTAPIRTYMRDNGLRDVMWDLNSFDYERKGTVKLEKWVIGNTYAGYTLLMHDGGGDRSQTIEALPHIIEAFEKKGYQFDVICKPPAVGTPQRGA